MKILESASKAWMIRNDGKAIPITQHVYGNTEDNEESLYAAEWLYDNSSHASTKQLCIEFIASYADFIAGDSRIDSLVSDIERKPYKFLSKKFVIAHKDELESAKSVDTESARKAIIDELNQEFLRARFGGMYNSSASSKEVVFRISSVGFNWYPIIWSFVYEHKSTVSSVTIVRDEESTGVKDFVYKSHSGERYFKMPVDEFLEESGNPVVEKLCVTSKSGDMILENLRIGSSIHDAKINTNMNYERFDNKLCKLRYLENCKK